MRTLVYASDLYERATLEYWATKYLERLPADVKTLVVRGSSGVSLASAMCILSKRPLNFIAIRKPGERSHASTYAGMFTTCEGKEGYLAIVDDFIQSGETVKELVRELERLNKLKFLKYLLVSHVEYIDMLKPHDLSPTTKIQFIILNP